MRQPSRTSSVHLETFEEAIMCVPGCHEAIHRALSRRRVFATATAFVATAVAPFAAEAAPRPGRKIVDLTHTMSVDFPTFNGTPGIAMQKVIDFKKDGYNLYHWRLNEHSGTHLDAPIHFSEAGMSADEIPAATLVVPLAVVNVADKAAKNADYQLSRGDIAAWERRHGRLPDNCCVAMNSGWARHVADKAKFVGRDSHGVMHFPGIAPEATAWLIKERKVAGLAVDTLSLDHGASKDFKTHVLWLPGGRWGLESVAALDSVPAVGATLVVGLAKVKGATGGPARLFALL
jgi:kynurenine formamidase